MGANVIISARTENRSVRLPLFGYDGAVPPQHAIQ